MTGNSGRRQATALSAADAVLKQKGRSFYWARRLLNNQHAAHATRLYSFCRYLDDLADEASSVDLARSALNGVKTAIRTGQANNLIVQDGLLLIQECSIDPHVVCQLIDGVYSDLEPVAIATLDELLQYCYQVAGTVGLMMCNVLDTKNPAALPHAIDLGIAMQLTNICRDVQADAIAGRRYLPASMVGDLLPTELVEPITTIQSPLQECVCQLLAIAERYYQSAERGLCYLPAGARVGILTAARIYREIGTCLALRRYRYWQGRVVVSSTRKVAVTARLLFEAPVSRSFWNPTHAHEPAMHRAFSALLSGGGSGSLVHGN